MNVIIACIGIIVCLIVIAWVVTDLFLEIDRLKLENKNLKESIQVRDIEINKLVKGE